MCPKKIKAIFFNRQAWTKFLVYCGLTVCCVALLSCELSILVSETDSHAFHYFLQFKHLKPRLNDYTVLGHPWFSEKMIKKIIGVSGDVVQVNEDHEVFINEKSIGVAQDFTSDGRRLHPIAPQIIREGRVFLYAPHPRSFDSRYQDVGLPPIVNLEGRAFPLW